MNSPIATLPLYDLPEARIQTDALWKGLADSFRKFGLNSEPDSMSFKVPDALFRADNCYAETVFFAQICGYPLTHEFSGRFQVIATPVYKTPFFFQEQNTEARLSCISNANGKHLRKQRVAEQ